MARIPGSDREIIDRQASALLDPASQITTMAAVLGSHKEAVEEPESEGFVRTPVAAIRQRGANVFVVPGQILVRAEHADEAARLLGADFSREAVDCPALPVVRFRTRLRNLAKAADMLHSAGISSNFSHITPSGPYITGEGGVEKPVGDPPKVEEGCFGGGKVTVAVIDTGINMTDTKWDATVLHGVDQTAANRDPVNAVSKGPLDHGGGHGTFVAGIVRQVAPRAQVVVYRALDSDGIGSEESVACAILAACAKGADIINLSLGTETYRDRPPVALAAALEQVPDEVVVVAAAGNEGTSRPNWPGAFKRVVAVAALGDDMRPVRWSNRGPWVDFSTVGAGVVSTFVIGFETQAQDPVPESWTTAMPWAMWSGTSFAAPQIAGMIADAAEGGDARQALAKLRTAGTHIADWGVAIPSPLTYQLA